LLSLATLSVSSMLFRRHLSFRKKTRLNWQSLGWSLMLVSNLIINPSCSTKKAQPNLPQSFVYRGDFYPAFLPTATFVIQTHQEAGQLKLTRYKSRSSREQLVDSVTLTESELRTFFSALDSVPLLKMATKEQVGADGIDVENSVSHNGLHNHFRFWSPRKPSQEHKLVEAVLGLARRKFLLQPQKAYFESLEEYFDFGLPCEITSTDPYEVRIYGVIYGEEKWVKDLQAFLQRLPTEQPILIDMTNSHGMAWNCFPVFRAFLARNKRVIWVLSPAALTDIKEIGVPTNHIARTVAQGRQLVQAL
jgi:hypothetical protein